MHNKHSLFFSISAIQCLLIYIWSYACVRYVMASLVMFLSCGILAGVSWSCLCYLCVAQSPTHPPHVYSLIVWLCYLTKMKWKDQVTQTHTPQQSIACMACLWRFWQEYMYFFFFVGFFFLRFLRGQRVGSGSYATFGNLTFGYTVLN